MKTKLKQLLPVLTLVLMYNHNLYAQCLPMIKIDGNDIVASEAHPSGIKLPSWLTAGQTLAKAQNTYSIAVIEFTVNGTALEYSQNISVTSNQIVPAGKVWKIESIHKDAGIIAPIVTSYTTPGTYTFTPSCSGTYLVKVWGAGGGGGAYVPSCNADGNGGGGGGYVEARFVLLSTVSYTITVGAGGLGGTLNHAVAPTNGGNSGVVALAISAFGGGGAKYPCIAGSGGVGGYGIGGNVYSGGGGGSGYGGNGGHGEGLGAPVSSTGGIMGNSPGGGGGGSAYPATANGGNGGNGQVDIILEGGTNSGAVQIPCVAMYLYSTNCAGACPVGWIDAGCGPNPGGSYASYIRTCYKCD